MNRLTIKKVGGHQKFEGNIRRNLELGDLFVDDLGVALLVIKVGTDFLQDAGADIAKNDRVRSASVGGNLHDLRSEHVGNGGGGFLSGIAIDDECMSFSGLKSDVFDRNGFTSFARSSRRRTSTRRGSSGHN